MAERESATFDLLSLANAGIEKLTTQIYPQIVNSIAFYFNGFGDLIFPLN